MGMLILFSLLVSACENGSETTITTISTRNSIHMKRHSTTSCSTAGWTNTTTDDAERRHKKRRDGDHMAIDGGKHISVGDLYTDIIRTHSHKRKFEIAACSDNATDNSSPEIVCKSPKALGEDSIRRSFSIAYQPDLRFGGSRLLQAANSEHVPIIPQHFGFSASPLFSSGKLLGASFLGQSKDSRATMSLNAFPADTNHRSRAKGSKAASSSPEPLGFQEDAQKQPELQQQQQQLAETQVPSPLGEVPVAATAKGHSISDEEDDGLVEPRVGGDVSPGRTPTGDEQQERMDEDDEHEQEAKRLRQHPVQQQQPDVQAQQLLILQNCGGKSPEELLAALAQLQSMHAPQLPEPAQWMSDTLDKQAARFEKSM